MEPKKKDKGKAEAKEINRADFVRTVWYSITLVVV